MYLLALYMIKLGSNEEPIVTCTPSIQTAVFKITSHLNLGEGSLERWMTLGTRWEMYKTSYEHLIVPESKDASRLLEPIQKAQELT